MVNNKIFIYNIVVNISVLCYILLGIECISLYFLCNKITIDKNILEVINLDKLVLNENSSIGRSNWITGFPTKSDSRHFAHDKGRESELIIGKESAITKNHHLDCTNAIHIGDLSQLQATIRSY